MPINNPIALYELDFTKLVPPGFCGWFSGLSVLPGWLIADGSALSRTVYADLFAAIGTAHGNGDGSTTFNIPDMRGEFIRGFDNGRGIDAGRIFGSAQSDSIGAHTHTVRTRNNTVAGSTDLTSLRAGWTQGGLTSEAAGAINNNGAGIGSESRPRNISFLGLIKY